MICFFLAEKVTNQLFAQVLIFAKSSFRLFAVSNLLSTSINKQVSSAKSLMLQFCTTWVISSINNKKRRGHSTVPCGTPASIGPQSDA